MKAIGGWGESSLNRLARSNHEGRALNYKQQIGGIDRLHGGHVTLDRDGDVIEAKGAGRAHDTKPLMDYERLRAVRRNKDSDVSIPYGAFGTSGDLPGKDSTPQPRVSVPGSQCDGHPDAELMRPANQHERCQEIAVAARLPIQRVEVCLDGGFLVDFGFPWKNDFSKSCQVEAAVFLGSGGFYIGQTSAAGADLLPSAHPHGFLARGRAGLADGALSLALDLPVSARHLLRWGHQTQQPLAGELVDKGVYDVANVAMDRGGSDERYCVRFTVWLFRPEMEHTIAEQFEFVRGDLLSLGFVRRKMEELLRVIRSFVTDDNKTHLRLDFEVLSEATLDDSPSESVVNNSFVPATSVRSCDLNRPTVSSGSIKAKPLMDYDRIRARMPEARMSPLYLLCTTRPAATNVGVGPTLKSKTWNRPCCLSIETTL